MNSLSMPGNLSENGVGFGGMSAQYIERNLFGDGLAVGCVGRDGDIKGFPRQNQWATRLGVDIKTLLGQKHTV